MEGRGEWNDVVEGEVEWREWISGVERSNALAAANLIPQFHFIFPLLLFNFILALC